MTDTRTNHSNLKDPLTQDPMLDHDYDGIKELDNPLPNWWLMTFYGAIVFSLLYVAYYHIGNGPSLHREYETELTDIQIRSSKETGSSEEDLKGILAAAKDPNQIQQGKTEFLGKCASCHGQHGEGLIGPNLTDRYWIHGDGSPLTILNVVRVGVPEKGMPPWNALIPAETQRALVAYIGSIANSNPPNAKAPQGNKVP